MFREDIQLWMYIPLFGMSNNRHNPARIPCYLLLKKKSF